MLGLLEQGEPATPYDLKQFAQLSTNNFWSVPHTQLYTECARLAAEGLLDERQEQTGRRRRVYRLTKRGRELLAAWRDAPATDLYELRDAATLKLFFGGDPATLAATQLQAHKRGWPSTRSCARASTRCPRASAWRWSAASATSASSSASGRAWPRHDA